MTSIQDDEQYLKYLDRKLSSLIRLLDSKISPSSITYSETVVFTNSNNIEKIVTVNRATIVSWIGDVYYPYGSINWADRMKIANQMYKKLKYL